MLNLLRRPISNARAPLTLASLAAAAVIGLGAQARADTSWKADSTPTLSGNFNDNNHWTSGIPTSAVVTNFAVAGTYTVTFTENEASQKLAPSLGDIKFDLAGWTYTIGSGITMINPAAANTSVNLDISNGTLASARSYVGYSNYSGATTAVTLSGKDSHWTSSASNEVGSSGTGSLSISNGATVSTGSSMTLGLNASGIGTLTVDGYADPTHLSTFTCGQDVSIGGAGTGTVKILNGGQMSGGYLRLAWNGANSVGTLLVSGAGSKYTSSNSVNVAGYTYQTTTYSPGASATVDLEDSGTLQATPGVNIYPNGHIIMKNGTIDAGTSIVDATRGGTFDISHRNYGTDTGNTLNGYLTLGATTDTTFHLASDSDYGNLKVTKTLTAAGTLDVVLDGVYAPSNGDAYDLFDGGTNTNPTFSGTFATVNLPTLAAGLSWDQSNLYTTGIIAVVPEPAALSLLAIGGLLALRRRRSC